MSGPEHANYYRRREAFARDRAAIAATPAIARIHTELANCYARIALADDTIYQIAANQASDPLSHPLEDRNNR